jgi:hypothetical protein
MPLRLNGSTSGYSQLDAPAIAGDQTFTLPGTGGTIDRLNRAGNILQVVNFQTGAVATGTTLIPIDDTIPQNTEGTEFMTLAITPTNANNKLLISVCTFLANTAANNLVSALFQDSTANALALGVVNTQTASALLEIYFTHFMTAGTTSSTTFKVRSGGNLASTVTFNGVSGTRYYGGALASSITITEIAA